MKKSLTSSEWILVASLILIMASLVVIAKVNAHRASSTLAIEDLEPEEILVTIEGAVAKPGTYSVPSGTTMESALRKARPKANANLKVLPLQQLIEAPLHLTLQELTEIAVSIRGAIAEPVEITLPAHSRICDLKSKVSFTTETDKRFFRRRRVLKDGEVVEVPKKTVEDNSAG